MAERIWDPRDPAHVAYFAATILAPLIAATRPLDLRTASAVDDAAKAWALSLPEVPATVLEAGLERLLATGPTWMPRPGDLRRACSEWVAERRRDLAPRAASIIAECAQCGGSGWEHVREADDALRVKRCGCHTMALALLADLPAPIALPAAAEEPVTS